MHQLCIAAGEDHHAEHPFGVSQHTASQEHLVVVQRICLPVPDERALVFGQVVVGRLTVNFAVKRGQLSNVVQQHGGLR